MLQWAGGQSPHMALSRKKPIGKGAGQGCNKTNQEVGLPARRL